MKLDDTVKIVSIVSGVVAVIVSAAGFVVNARLQDLQASINKLGVQEKTMDVSKKAYDLSARLSVEFAAPLARSFATQYAESMADPSKRVRQISMPTQIAPEFSQVLGGWEGRRGLMTGEACNPAVGLKARQVVTLVVQNLGQTDAKNVVLKVKMKRSPRGAPLLTWEDPSAGGVWTGKADLTAAGGWADAEVPIGHLPGAGSPAEARKPVQVVLASVSGRTWLYGTVLVPVSIAWTDDISPQPHSEPVIAAHATQLGADLLGAEIGSVRSACPQAPAAPSA